MISFLIAALLIVAAALSLGTIHSALRKGFAAARLISRQLADLDAPAPALARTRPVRVVAPRRIARPAAAGLRAAA